MPKYVNVKTGQEVKEGDILVDFRGEEWKFITVTQQGRRVYVKPADGSGFAREFYPQVFPGYEVVSERDICRTCDGRGCQVCRDDEKYAPHIED